MNVIDELDERRWRAVAGRDDAVAGVFVYGVRTTGVFCRPGCSSRRPLRRNVEYFTTPSQAVTSGYRACRKCRPDAERSSDPAIAAVVAACRRLEADPTQSDVAVIAGDVGLSERHLRRLFAQLVGVPLGSYVRALRADRARSALRDGARVSDAVTSAGYGSFRAFYEDGAERLGMTPARFRDGGRGERIGYTSTVTPLGVVVAASTARGVCFVRLGGDEAALTKELAAEFPQALIERDDEALVDVAGVLGGATRGERDAGQLPLDLAGTAFQLRVWDALRAIPAGQTRTYSQVAASIERPRAVRAVASACAANPAALAVPCHRVVRGDGGLGGYRWGVDVKEALLVAERGTASDERSAGAPARSGRRAERPVAQVSASPRSG